MNTFYQQPFKHHLFFPIQKQSLQRLCIIIVKIVLKSIPLNNYDSSSIAPSSVAVSKITISTRRFFAIFSAVSLGAAGLISPYPARAKRSSSISKLSIKYRITLEALAPDSSQFDG